MSILITGATGFIGSEVLCRLVKAAPSETLVVLGRRPPDFQKGLFAERVAQHGLTPTDFTRVEFVQTDFADSARLGADLAKLAERGQDWVIVHLAAVIHGGGDAAAQERLNVGVTHELLDWLNAIGGRHFVFTSSVVAFGGTRRPVVRDEDSFRNFPEESSAFPYYRTKREAHISILRRAKVPVSLLCPGVVHGPLENYKPTRRHLAALRDGRLSLAPPGGVNIVSLDEVAEALLRAALEARPEGARTRLLVERNMEVVDYFQLYVQIARGAQAQRIRRVPAWVGTLARAVYPLASTWGLAGGFLEGLAQGSLYHFFRTRYPSAGAPDEPERHRLLEQALRDSLPVRPA
jgi:nucleoside-diphosphate-sugar epimerase